MARRLLKDAAKGLPYPVFLRLFNAWSRFFDQSPLRRRLRAHSIPLLPDVITQRKRSETLFILGSGGSINAISEARWQAIARHDTAGLNFWLFHRFVPRFYFFESLTPAAPAMYRAFLEIAGRRSADYAEAPKIASSFDGSEEQTPWRAFARNENVYAVLNYVAPCRNVEEMTRAMRYFATKGAFAPGERMAYLFKHCSSLSMVISFAVKMGYRRIVLCGVDLSSSRYFFQDPILYPESAQLEFVCADAPHPTSVEAAWLVSMAEVLGAFKEVLLEPAGIRLYVENKCSALWPSVPELPADFARASDAVITQSMQHAG